MRVREVADAVGITERMAARIISDLEEAGAIKRIKHGRRNSYEVQLEIELRHPVESGHRLRELISEIIRPSSD